jgi:biotin-(acetyl-CoA carboxylase) ligase
MLSTDPQFPPLYSAHAIAAPDMPGAAAIAAIAAGNGQAGDIFWARTTADGTCAIILEPHKPLEIAMQAVPIAMVALGDALGAIAPPNIAVTYRWPSAILVNGADAGHVDAILPEFPHVGRTVPWLVLVMTIAIRRESDDCEPGENAGQTVLWEEGCGDIDRTGLLEAFARHFLAWMDRWEEEGFGPVHRLWLFRAADLDDTFSFQGPSGPITGKMLGLDDNGGLLLRTDEGVSGYSLAEYAGRTMAAP